MSKNLSIGDRVLRSAVVGALGAVAGFVLMLSIDFWKRSYASDTFLLPATLIGGGLGAVLGFFLSDSDWLDLFRKR
jgi:hypothetical protein